MRVIQQIFRRYNIRDSNEDMRSIATICPHDYSLSVSFITDVNTSSMVLGQNYIAEYCRWKPSEMLYMPQNAALFMSVIVVAILVSHTTLQTQKRNNIQVTRHIVMWNTRLLRMAYGS